MKRIRIMAVVLAVCGALFFQSCEFEENEGGNEVKISSFNDDESHNNGENCMVCHVSGGEGEGWFTVAGSVYADDQSAEFPNAIINLRTEANGQGTLQYSLEGDGNGNFYSTEEIDFGDGLYASVEGNEGTKYMATKLSSGACNSCHGSSTGKIWTK